MSTVAYMLCKSIRKSLCVIAWAVVWWRFHRLVSVSRINCDAVASSWIVFYAETCANLKPQLKFKRRRKWNTVLMLITQKLQINETRDNRISRRPQGWSRMSVFTSLHATSQYFYNKAILIKCTFAQTTNPLVLFGLYFTRYKPVFLKSILP